MRSERVSVLVVLLTAAIALKGTAAAAEPSPPAIPPVLARLELESKPACTTREELIARVAARSQRIRFVPEAPDAPALRATVAPGPAGSVVAELTIVQRGGKRSVRRIVARGCAEATDALGLVVTIALDPSFVAASDAPDAAAPKAAAAAAPPPPAPPPAPHIPPPARSEGPVAVAAPVPPSERRFGVGVFTAALFGPSPEALLGFGVEVSASLDRASVWSPSVGLRGMHASRDGLVQRGGNAGFSFDAVGLDVCLVRVRLAAVQVRGCGAALAGVLSASGSNTYYGRSSSRPFATAGGAVVVTVDLGPRIVLSARSSLGASLVRDAYQFTPEVFHRISSVTLGLDLGLGLRFP